MLNRYYETLRHLRWIQIWDRARRRIFAPTARAAVGTKLQRTQDWLVPPVKENQLLNNDDIHIFGIKRSFSSASIWTDNTVPKLWLYQLHYFDFLGDNLISDERRQELIRAWMVANPPGSKPGWEPYPTSRRIVNWLKLYQAGSQLSDAAADSLATQCDYLSRAIEFHLLGNHLIANLKALLFGGYLVQSPWSASWTTQATALLKTQLSEQILPDGGHHELSPMYHAVVLEDILDLLNLTRTKDPALANILRYTAAGMLRWLHIMSHPDGDISFFNDAALNGCASPGSLAEYAKRLGVADGGVQEDCEVALLPDSGYVRLSTKHIVVIADVGAVGPAHQPGHAHADTLSFETSVHGRKIAVNTGISTYENDDERLRQRGTPAHNTITIDGINSSDVWSAFRVGRRASVFDRSTTNLPQLKSAAASHNGYLSQSGTVHHREWRLTDNKLEICEKLSGRGNHRIEWVLHLHPDVSAVQFAPGRFRLGLLDSDVRLVVTTDERLHIAVVKSTYHPGFGSQLASVRLEGSAILQLPVHLTSYITVDI